MITGHCWALVRRRITGEEYKDYSAVSFDPEICRQKGARIDAADPNYAENFPIVGICRMALVEGSVEYDAEGGGK